jgi:hypothetical protein
MAIRISASDFPLLARLNKGSKRGIDTGLIAAAMRLEPIQYLGVEAEVNAALATWHPQHNSILPAFG